MNNNVDNSDGINSSNMTPDKSWSKDGVYKIDYYYNLSEEFLDKHEKLHRLMREIIDNKK